jgi:hypothetical protein
MLRSLCTRCRAPSIQTSTVRWLSSSTTLEKGGPRTTQRKPLPRGRPGAPPSNSPRAPVGKHVSRSETYQAPVVRDGRSMQGTQGWRKDERGTGGPTSRFSNRDRTPIEPTTSRRLARDLEPTPTLRTNFSKGAPAPRPIKLDPSFPPNLQPTPSAFIAKSQPKESIPSLPFSDYSLNPALKEGLAKFFAPSNPDPSNGQPQPPLPTPIQHLSLQHFLGSKNRPLNKKPGRKEVHQVLLLNGRIRASHPFLPSSRAVNRETCRTSISWTTYLPRRGRK